MIIVAWAVENDDIRDRKTDYLSYDRPANTGKSDMH